MIDTNLGPSTTPATPRKLQAPRTGNFLGRLSVGQKLLLSGLLLGVPAGALVVNTLNAEQAQINTLDTQIKGQQFLEPLAQTQYRIRAAWPLALAYSTGDQKVADQYKQASAEALAQLDTAAKLAQQNGDTELVNQIKATQQAYSNLTDGLLNKRVSYPEYISGTGKILSADLLGLFNKVSEDYGMHLASNEKMYDLLRISTEQLPATFPVVAATFAEGVNSARTAAGQQGTLTEAQKTQLGFAVRQGRQVQQQLTAQFAALENDHIELSGSLKGKLADLASQTEEGLNLVDAQLLQPQRITLAPQDITAFTGRLQPLQYDTYTAVNNEIGQELQSQRQNVQRRFIALLLGAILLALVLVGLLILVARSITQPLERLSGAAAALARGQFGARVPVTTSDEFGALSATFNTAAAQLEANERRAEQERIEQEQLQNNIGQFLDVTMDIAEGDLTKRGVVTEDVLGNVVDSINLMTEELGSVLGDVQKASGSVTNGSHQMLNSTENIQQGAEQTAQAAQQVAEQTSAVNRQIQAMAQLAQASAEAARQALLASNEGQQAVQETLSGMQEIRETTQTAEERIAALSERSRQIGQIVDTISAIASQTNLLSLHASIEAAGAGTAGERFSVVADEVRQLADESAQATRQITSLITGIQREIAETVRTIQDNARQVNEGYQVAGTAGERLEQIGELSRESARLAEQISISSREQVQNIEQVSSSVQDIAQTAEHSQQSVEQGRAAAQQLQQLAENLSASLARFRLPG